MNRSIVVTDVCKEPPQAVLSYIVRRVPPACLDSHLAAIGHHCHRSIGIGSPDRHPMAAKPVQCGRGGMAVVVMTDRYHRGAGTQRIEPLVTGAAPAAMMAHLEQIDGTRSASHL